MNLFIGRELHPDNRDDGTVYVFRERPTKGEYNNGHYYFWHVKDPSNKIQLSAGDSYIFSAGEKGNKIEKGQLFRLKRTIQ